METLDRKIEEMISDMKARVEAMHEHASTAANLKDDVASLREAVQATAKAASDTSQALYDAIEGFVETHNTAISSGSSTFEEIAGKAGASLEAASDRASAAVEAFERNASSLVEALEAKTAELAARAASQEANSQAQIDSAAARALQAMKEVSALTQEQVEVLASASQKNIETVDELKLIARELKEVQETGLKNLEVALDERIRTTLEEKNAEQWDIAATKMDQRLNDFGEKSDAELNKRLKAMKLEMGLSVQKSANWAIIAALAASAGVALSVYGFFGG